MVSILTDCPHREKLGWLEPGLKRGFLEGRAVIYNQKTALVLDILDLF
jgi:hypothetical protein